MKRGSRKTFENQFLFWDDFFGYHDGIYGFDIFWFGDTVTHLYGDMFVFLSDVSRCFQPRLVFCGHFQIDLISFDTSP